MSQQRKTSRNSLKKPLCENESGDLGIDANLRVGNMTLVEFAKVSNAVSQKVAQELV